LIVIFLTIIQAYSRKTINSTTPNITTGLTIKDAQSSFQHMLQPEVNLSVKLVMCLCSVW
ncbi:hypothetical protein Q8G71_35060, partial [Klebsiella pneumoniae]